MFEPTMVNIKRTRKQRVKPQQDRGKEMVAVLLESARRVLVAHGYAGLTSARIAETAGVSVGTLYH
ncbi:MAG: helix-turn-helix domain-containing protein, partial [Bdellovibrionota bacterium]